MRIGLVTCVKLPDPDPDQPLLLDALRLGGHEPAMLPWDHPAADPRAFDLCILRSCWNYHERPQEFLDWIDRANLVTRLYNRADVIHWNIDKRYLKELQKAGVAIVPTEWVSKGLPISLTETMKRNAWMEVVIKPCISAGSANTKRFHLSKVDKAQKFLNQLAADRHVMVQPYLPSVEEEGEKAVISIAGQLTHAVRKSPRFAGGDESVSEAVPVTPEEASFAKRALACVKGREDLLYARIDIMRDHQGKLCVSELELIEPSLFFKQWTGALSLFVESISKLGVARVI